MGWFVYILRCKNGDLYTGMTSNLERRMCEHQSGKGGRFTKSVRPVELLSHEVFLARQEAVDRERPLKGWSRKKKLALASGSVETLKVIWWEESVMRIGYDRRKDILLVEVSRKPVDHAEEIGPLIVHFSKQNQPVLIEVLDASDFLSAATKVTARAKIEQLVPL